MQNKRMSHFLSILLEESYEFVDAVAGGDRVDMREELGDVLLQVYFHARIAEDHPTVIHFQLKMLLKASLIS